MENSKKVEFCVSEPHGYHINMPWEASMGALKQIYAANMGIPADSFMFVINGIPVQNSDTPKSLNLKIDDTIDVAYIPNHPFTGC